MTQAMANTHHLFKRFDQALSVSKEKESLKKARMEIRRRITGYFKKDHNLDIVMKGIGSYVLGTIIQKKDGRVDLDEGIFFPQKPVESARQTMKLVHEVVKKMNIPTEHHQHCITVAYNSYNVDLPCFVKADIRDTKPARLATKDDEWITDDPIAFEKWFNGKKDSDGQLLRLVRYLKAWCDYRSQAMPKGVVMTTLAAKCFNRQINRDDKALMHTLQTIHQSLSDKWSLKMPIPNGEDLLLDFTSHKSNFMDALRRFIEDGERAINEAGSEEKAARLWQRHLGDRFPVS
ncbi:MAG: CBASS cGAMP synthase [Cyclobacteriaceae bacterium]